MNGMDLFDALAGIDDDLIDAALTGGAAIRPAGEDRRKRAARIFKSPVRRAAAPVAAAIAAVLIAAVLLPSLLTVRTGFVGSALSRIDALLRQSPGTGETALSPLPNETTAAVTPQEPVLLKVPAPAFFYSPPEVSVTEPPLNEAETRYPASYPFWSVPSVNDKGETLTQIQPLPGRRDTWQRQDPETYDWVAGKWTEFLTENGISAEWEIMDSDILYLYLSESDLVRLENCPYIGQIRRAADYFGNS